MTEIPKNYDYGCCLDLPEDYVLACSPVSDDDVDLLPDDSSHVPGHGVDRLVASSFCTKAFTFFIAGVSVCLDDDDGGGTVQIARSYPSS